MSIYTLRLCILYGAFKINIYQGNAVEKYAVLDSPTTMFNNVEL